MSVKKSRLFILSILIVAYINAKAGTVDSLEIPSAVMNKTYKAAVVLPSTYQNNKKAYPVLYLLHGGGGISGIG
jgi:enterochelin esterase-like enzyme